MRYNSTNPNLQAWLRQSFFFTLNFKHHFQAFLAKRVKARTAVKKWFLKLSFHPNLSSSLGTWFQFLYWFGNTQKWFFSPTNSVRPLSPGQNIFTDGEQSETSSTKTRIKMLQLTSLVSYCNENFMGMEKENMREVARVDKRYWYLRNSADCKAQFSKAFPWLIELICILCKLQVFSGGVYINLSSCMQSLFLLVSNNVYCLCTTETGTNALP